MAEKVITKQEVLKEIEKVLNLYEDNIVNISYSISLTFEDFNNVEIRKNYYLGHGICNTVV